MERNWDNITTVSVCLGNTASEGTHYTVIKHPLICFHHTGVMCSMGYLIAAAEGWLVPFHPSVWEGDGKRAVNWPLTSPTPPVLGAARTFGFGAT